MKIAIIGGGPWGMAVLERLIINGNMQPDTHFSIDVYDPRDPGPGVHDTNLEDYLWLNTHYLQIDAFSAPTFGEQPLTGAKSFRQWLIATGAYDPDVIYYRRSLYGRYMKFVYGVLRSNAASNITVTHIKAVVDKIRFQPESGRERLESGNAHNLYDYAIICTGHGLQHRSSADSGVEFTSYSGRRIGLAGMGLDAIDRIMGFTTGLGGEFCSSSDGSLSYRKSGKEPELYLFSRHGLPFHCRPDVSLDGLYGYVPRYCTEAALRDIRTNRGRVDFETDILPLLVNELRGVYHYHSRRISGVNMTEGTDYEPDWPAPTRDESLPDPSVLFRSRALRKYACPSEYVDEISKYIGSDVHQSCIGEKNSPYKASLEVFRLFRSFIRDSVEFGMLTPDSGERFFNYYAPRFNQISVGPPAIRGRQFLALLRAGVIRLDLGPAPVLTGSDSTGYLATTTCFENNFSVVLDGFCRAFRDQPVRAKPEMIVQRAPDYAFDIGPDWRIRDGEGDPRNLFIAGVPTNGWTYFSSYFPSPKSRSKAFLIADRIAAVVMRPA